MIQNYINHITEIKQKLKGLSPTEYELLNVYQDSSIKDYVESWIKLPYVEGSYYYQLTKPETIQHYKQICIQDKKNGKVYTGLNARKMINFSGYEIKVSPGNFHNFDIFVQSTSVNRKLQKGTKIIVLK